MKKMVAGSKKKVTKKSSAKKDDANKARMDALMRCASECDDFGVLTQEGYVEGEDPNKTFLVAMNHKDAIKNFKMALSCYKGNSIIGFAIYFKKD